MIKNVSLPFRVSENPHWCLGVTHFHELLGRPMILLDSFLTLSLCESASRTWIFFIFYNVHVHVIEWAMVTGKRDVMIWILQRLFLLQRVFYPLILITSILNFVIFVCFLLTWNMSLPSMYFGVIFNVSLKFKKNFSLVLKHKFNAKWNLQGKN